MILPLTIPLIDDHLGHSVFDAEYKGNFAQARDAAEHAMRIAEQRDSSIQLADALLGLGVVHLLQGEAVAATANLIRSEHLASEDLARQLRAAMYWNLAAHQKFNIFPGGRSAEGSEIKARWDPLAHANENSPLRQALLGMVEDPALVLEHQMVETMLLIPSNSSIVANNRSLLSVLIPNNLINGARAMGAVNVEAVGNLMAAQLCWWAADPKTARKHLRTARNRYDEVSDQVGKAVCEMTQGDWLVAPFSSPDVWNFWIQEGRTTNDLGPDIETQEFSGISIDSSRIDRGGKAYAQAARLFARAGAPRGVAAIRLREGYLAALLGDYSSAASHARSAAEAFEATGDRMRAWLARSHFVLSLIGSGQPHAGRETAVSIGDWGRDGGSFSFALGVGILFCRAGRYWLVNRGQYESAIACYQLAETLFRALGAMGSSAQAAAEQGITYRLVGDSAAAAVAYERARQLYAEVLNKGPAVASNIRRRTAELDSQMYWLYHESRDVGGMAQSLSRLQAWAGSGPEERSFLEALGEGGLPSASSSWDDMESALEDLTTAKIAQELCETATVSIHWFRAKNARDAGSDEEAEGHFKLALEATSAVGPEQRETLSAAVLGDQRRYGEAVAAWHRHLALRGVVPSGLWGMVESEAKEINKQQQGSKSHTDLRDASILEHSAAFLARVKQFDEAKAYLDALESMAGRDWWRRKESPWAELKTYGDVYGGLARYEEAFEFYDQAIDLLESRRGALRRDDLKIALQGGSDAQSLYFNAALTAMDMHRAAENAGDAAGASVHAARAFSYAERGKARALVDLMAASALVGSGSDSEEIEMRTWRELNAKLTTWYGLVTRERSEQTPNITRITYLAEQIKAVESELQRAEQNLYAVRPQFFEAALNRNIPVPTPEEICSGLPSNTALIEYFFLNDDLLAWAMSSDGQFRAWQTKCNAKWLERKIRAFRKACYENFGVAELGQELANALLAKFAEVLRDHVNLVVVPYSAAHLLPFQALPWQGEPLIGTHTLCYLPSCSLLHFLDVGATAFSDSILAIGNPAGMAYDPLLESLPDPLPAAEVESMALPAAEVESIVVASLFPKGNALFGDQATESEVRKQLPHYRILHFATHAQYSKEAPLRSSLLLANGERLTVYELMGLKLEADLVVLSACGTGLGYTTRGDDVLGLTRGLLAAGARAAVVSLWEVNDYSTALFMGEFYRRLRAGASLAQALQASQNYLRRLRGHDLKREFDRLKIGEHGWDLQSAAEQIQSQSYPYAAPTYWAPFILIARPS